MTLMHIVAPRLRSFELARMLGHAVAKFRKRLRIRRDIAALDGLSDHLLRDMGLEDHILQRQAFPHQLPAVNTNRKEKR